MALVESGKPANTKDFQAVKVDKLKIYVPKAKKFAGGIPKIVDFPRNNGRRDVGVSNTL